MVERKQRGLLRIDAKNHVASVPAVRPIGATKWLKFFSADGGDAVAALTSLNVQGYSVDKIGHNFLTISGG